MSNQRTSSNTVLVSLLAGAAGAAVALLFAPRSGEETRERLQQKSDDLKEQAKDSMDTAKSKAEEKFDEAKDLKDRLTTAITKSSERAKEEAKKELNTSSDRDVTTENRSPVLNNWEEEA